MMLNNKGFSLVELLAIITILGLIMGTAIPAYQQYVTKTRKEAYDTLITSSRTAAQNKFLADGQPIVCKKYYIVEDLYGGGYMDKPSDPASTATNCTGEVYIKSAPDSETDLMENYYLSVHLKCSVYETTDCKDSGGHACTSIDFDDCE